MQSWELVRVFLALQRARSYEGASQALNMDISTVRRKIQALESSIGSSLFTRDSNGIVLLPECEHLLNAALDMESGATQFRSHSEKMNEEGLVRITVLDIFASLIIDGMKRFRHEHPGIVLDITTESRFVDLEKEGVDLAVRAARPIRGSSGVRKLADIPFGNYVSRDYFEANKDTPRWEMSVISMASDFWHRDHEFMLVDERQKQLYRQPENLTCRVDSYILLRQLCESGLGVAKLPKFFAEQSPGLVQLDNEFCNIELWLVLRQELARSKRIKQTINFLVKVFSDHSFAKGTPVLASAVEVYG
ncbi:LysR family transcriptional regulator [Ensifer adhaerens]|uniref:LysR family transcriptional regulator n=1 Tax=Ensifer adhaerens TaxID=106592 RepID=UPI001CBBB6BB|nr:LysR family transcriptional regulator [Ensifer adhaerens]MBZ7924239.1 LysR family transcriptional regulator [Ensifer adhaerens]UAX96507.1 LysR family transcriptional regulator [Ensifer adhaerens]UAY04149.1 LysR family transcriptional regulator [Ensifer adhaerens]UAY12135.1 LysR family transcriptional regulator [Ensifer adhaerens]